MPEDLVTPSRDPALLTAGPLAFLPEAEARALIDRSRTLSFKRGERVLRQGDRPSALLIAVAGRLKRVVEGDEAATRMIELYQPVGLDCLLDGAAYGYSVFAEQDSAVRAVAWKDLKALIDRVPHLETYLRVVSESAAVREMDLSLNEMGCSPGFRTALLGALEFHSAAPETWLVREGAVPSFIYYDVLGTVQAFGKGEEGELKALWIAPNFTWQLFEEWSARAPLSHHLKAVSKVDYYRLPGPVLEALRERYPKDFEAFAKLALRIRVEREEEEEKTETETLQDLFPTPPRPTKSFRFTYPWVQQNDEMDCGPACMAMISKYFGNDLPVQFWRSRMSTNQEGTSLFDLSKAAEKVGFVTHGLQIESFKDLEPSMFPVIALRNEHYLVVYHWNKAAITVGDPAVGVRRMHWTEFRRGFDGFVLALKPTDQFYQVVAPARGYWHFLDMFKGQSFELGLILATSLMLTVLQIFPAFVFQFIIDQVLVKKDSHLLLLILAASALVMVMMAAVSWLRQYYLAFVTVRFDFAAVSAFMRKVFSLPYSFFATRHLGDFSRRLTELETIKDFVTERAIYTLLSFLNLAVYGIALFRYNTKVALMVYLSAPVLLGLSVLFSKRLKIQYGEVFATRAELEGLLADQIKGIATIKTLGAEVASRWRFEEATVRTLRALYGFSLTGASLGALEGLVDDILNLAVIGLAAYLALLDQMTPGQVVAVSILSAGVIGPFNHLAGMWTEIQQMRTSLDRLNDVFLSEPESRPDRRALIKERLRGEIEFRDVWFRYGGEATDWVLKGMSFHIPPGRSVAIVGNSGSGKSTLALLTARLFEPTKGTILIDGRDYREYDRQWLRKQIGLLLQDTNLFHGSLIDNIAYGEARANVAKVEAVAELADAKKFIQEKSSGFDYMITHGGLGLSAGQRQRLAIARILYTDPAILFMDEATSSLDALSERRIVAALKDASRDRTVVSIAHRYNTVKMSDFAMVIDDGRVVEFGTHAKLLTLGGHYARLFGDQIRH